MSEQLFRVKHNETGDFLDERWGDDLQHLESHLLIGPTGRVFWMQWDGLKELTADVEVVWPALAAERDRICAAIKATDDAASAHDYMLDSDDCIAVVRGELGPANYPDVPARAGNGGEG